MNEIKNVPDMETAQKLADKIDGVLIMLDGTTAIISGGDLSRIKGAE